MQPRLSSRQQALQLSSPALQPRPVLQLLLEGAEARLPWPPSPKSLQPQSSPRVPSLKRPLHPGPLMWEAGDASVAQLLQMLPPQGLPA